MSPDADPVLVCTNRNCTGPVSNLVDFLAPMQWVPTKMHSRGKRLHEQLAATYGGMIKDIERRMRAGEEVPDCLAKTMIELRESEGLDDLDMAILASAFMIGGVETVSVGLFFFLIVAKPPDLTPRMTVTDGVHYAVVLCADPRVP